MDDGIKADGSEVRFGPNPIGMVVFAADGHYSLQIIYPFSVTGGYYGNHGGAFRLKKIGEL